MSSQSQHEKNLDDGLDEAAFAMDAHTAASVGDIPQLQTAVEAAGGGDGPNRRNRSGWTALMYAAHYDHAGVISFLASVGADGTAACGPEGRGRTAIMMAAMCGNEEALKTLIRHFGGMGAALLEARDGDGGGMTALGYAAVNGHAGAATILLESGARTDVVEDTKGYTPLMLACLEGHEMVAQWLLHHGADISYANILGETARTVADKVGHLNIVQLLDRNGSAPPSSVAAQGILAGPAKLAEKLAKQQQKQQREQLLDPDELATDLWSFLVQAGVEKYHQSFLDHDIDLEKLLDMGDDDLKSIGIVLLGPRRKLTSAIARHRQRQDELVRGSPPPRPSEAWS